MTGWVILLLLAGALAIGLLYVARPDRHGAMLIVSALALTLAGYSWQGRPDLPGKPTRPQDTRPPPDTLFASERKVWIESVGRDPELLDAADNLIARGDADYAIGILRGGLVRSPKSSLLWLGLGNALVHYANGAVTPPARFAFERAAALAPGRPAAPYFLGLAYAVSGDLAAANTIWTALLRDAPADAIWRDRVIARLFLLRQIEQGQPRQP